MSHLDNPFIISHKNGEFLKMSESNYTKTSVKKETKTKVDQEKGVDNLNCSPNLYISETLQNGV